MAESEETYVFLTLLMVTLLPEQGISEDHDLSFDYSRFLNNIDYTFNIELHEFGESIVPNSEQQRSIHRISDVFRERAIERDLDRHYDHVERDLNGDGYGDEVVVA